MSTEADILRCGYNVGFFEKSDIANWADRQIEAIDDPCNALLDLSMIQRTHPLYVMNLLRSLGSTDSSATIETQIGFIGLLLTQRRITMQVAIRGLWTLVHEPNINEEQRSHIYFLEDGYDLAAAGTYGTIDDIERELYNFVFPYAQRLTEQYPHLIPSIE